MNILKGQLVASEVGIYFQITKTAVDCPGGFMQTHSTFVLGILKHLNMMYFKIHY